MLAIDRAWAGASDHTVGPGFSGAWGPGYGITGFQGQRSKKELYHLLWYIVDGSQCVHCHVFLRRLHWTTRGLGEAEHRAFHSVDTSQFKQSLEVRLVWWYSHLGKDQTPLSTDSNNPNRRMLLPHKRPHADLCELWLSKNQYLNPSLIMKRSSLLCPGVVFFGERKD